MTASTATGISVVLLLVFLKMLSAAGFSALINARKSWLRERAEEKHQGAARALKLGEDATHLLATQQFLSVLFNLVVMTLIAIQLEPNLEKGLTNANLNQTLSQVLAYMVLLPICAIVLMIADRVATSLVIGRAESYALASGLFLGWIIRLLSPVIVTILKLSSRLAVMMGGSPETHFVTAEEIKTLVDASSEDGGLEDEEKEMIYSVIRFGETVAREVMVPRIDMVSLDVEDATLEEALELIIKAGHSRIPVYRGTIDNIEGVLYAKDLLKVWQSGQRLESIQSLLRAPYFVPESKNASELLVELQKQKVHLVIVVDEYGGTAGLLSIEDLVEEIVGEIQDEYDIHEEAQFEKISDVEYIFNSRFDLDNLNHLLDVAIPTDESDTLGGYIFTHLGRVPSVGDTFVNHNLEFEVLSVTGRRIRKVRVKSLEPSEEQEKETEVPSPEHNSGKELFRSSLPNTPSV